MGLGEAVVGTRRGVRLALVTLLLVLLAPIGVAGGLGMAPAMAILGLVTAILGTTKARDYREPMSGWFWGLMLFALWAAASSLWSRYPVPGGWDVLTSNPVKLLLGVVLYTVAAGAVLQTARLRPVFVQRLAVGAMVALLVITIIDLATGYGLSFLFDPVGVGEDPERRRGDAEQNVGHGITMACLLLSGAGVAVWRLLSVHGRTVQWAGVALLGAALLVASILGGLWIGMLCTLAVAAVSALAVYFPRTATMLAFAGAALTLILAPVIGRLCAGMSAGAKADLPFSWEHRVEGWAYVTERIFERPLLGHGFDAVRTFDAVKDIRGYDMSLVSLHPHNAGLHIWVEAGAIGVGLAVFALILLARQTLEWVGESRARAIASAGFVTAATLICSISYGVWQEWWWASLFLAAALVPVFLREA